MSRTAKRASGIRHYFVDEAGDPTLFEPKRGRVIIGTEGCSRYFMLGLVDMDAPDTLAHELADLRARLLVDPYFKGVPSMQPENKKTALAFHAKDDLGEVRREVFAVLQQHIEEIRFFGVIRDKHKVLEYVRQRNATDEAYRYNPNELYDYMVRRLFKNLLHKSDGYRVSFARRGNSDRTGALQAALEAARQRFAVQWGINSDAPIEVIASKAQDEAGLQVTDYLLWALQRLYERHEERYVELVRPALRWVHDVDDTRTAQYGTYYTRKKPLTLAALSHTRDIGAPAP